MFLNLKNDLLAARKHLFFVSFLLPCFLSNILCINKVFIIRLFSSHLNKLFICFHSHKKRSILLEFLKFIVLFQYRLKTGSLIRDCDWLFGARFTSFSRLFRTRAFVRASISSFVSDSINEMKIQLNCVWCCELL